MPNSREHDHLLSNRFRVEIEGVTAGDFAEVSGLESRTEVIEYADGSDPHVRKRPGRTTFSNIVLTKGALTTHGLWEWYKSVMQGKLERKGGSVIVLGDDMSEKYRYNFYEAWPCRWKSLQLDDPKDGNVELLFRDITPSLKNFSLKAINACQDTLYCGQIHYELNGFLHVCVKR